MLRAIFGRAPLPDRGGRRRPKALLSRPRSKGRRYRGLWWHGCRRCSGRPSPRHADTPSRCAALSAALPTGPCSVPAPAAEPPPRRPGRAALGTQQPEALRSWPAARARARMQVWTKPLPRPLRREAWGVPRGQIRVVSSERSWVRLVGHVSVAAVAAHPTWRPRRVRFCSGSRPHALG